MLASLPRWKKRYTMQTHSISHMDGLFARLYSSQMQTCPARMIHERLLSHSFVPLRSVTAHARLSEASRTSISVAAAGLVEGPSKSSWFAFHVRFPKVMLRLCLPFGQLLYEDGSRSCFVSTPDSTENNGGRRRRGIQNQCGPAG